MMVLFFSSAFPSCSSAACSAGTISALAFCTYMIFFRVSWVLGLGMIVGREARRRLVGFRVSHLLGPAELTGGW